MWQQLGNLGSNAVNLIPGVKGARAIGDIPLWRGAATNAEAVARSSNPETRWILNPKAVENGQAPIYEDIVNPIYDKPIATVGDVASTAALGGGAIYGLSQADDIGGYLAERNETNDQINDAARIAAIRDSSRQIDADNMRAMYEKELESKLAVAFLTAGQNNQNLIQQAYR